MTMTARTITATLPSHMRVFDSLSYLRMSFSTSSAVPTSTYSMSVVVSTTCSVKLSCFFLSDIPNAPLCLNIYMLNKKAQPLLSGSG